MLTETLLAQSIQDESYLEIPVERILPNPDQPRKIFDETYLVSLAESIKKHGLIQAIRVEGPHSGLIKAHPDWECFILVDGECRLRAHKIAGIPTIRAVVSQKSEQPTSSRLERAMIANLQRKDLNPVEEGRAYARLKSHKWTILSIASLAGRSKGHVEFHLKLLEFDPEIQEFFASGALPVDSVVVYGLFKLPEDLRLKLATRYALKKMSCNGIRLSLARVTRNFGEERDIDLTRSKRAPALHQSAGGQVEPSKLFVALEKDGLCPGWDMIEQAAKETCTSCPIHDAASVKVCQECPALELVKRLTLLAEKSNLGGAHE